MWWQPTWKFVSNELNLPNRLPPLSTACQDALTMCPHILNRMEQMEGKPLRIPAFQLRDEIKSMPKASAMSLWLSLSCLRLGCLQLFHFSRFIFYEPTRSYSTLGWFGLIGWKTGDMLQERCWLCKLEVPQRKCRGWNLLENLFKGVLVKKGKLNWSSISSPSD